MRALLRTTALLLATASAWGCAEEIPTSNEGGRIVIEPRTVELILPWDIFGEDARVFGGFGSADDLLNVVVANDYQGGLDSRGLVALADFPDRITVRDTVGENVTDSALTYISGRLVARVDTIASSAVDGPVEFSIGRILEEYHPPTAVWDLAVDTVGDRRAWTVPGGGAIDRISSGTWDPAMGDSVVFELDSAQLAVLGDTAEVVRAIRLDLESAGNRLEIADLLLRLDTRPSVNPDSTFVLTSPVPTRTFIYQPFAPPPPDGLRVGGAPAWRTVLNLNVPRVLTGPQEVCDEVGCPFTLDPDQINTASILLSTREVIPAAFQPSDTLRMDVRPVLAPERLPKAPLGGSFLGFLGRGIPQEAFGPDGSIEVGIPVTEFVRTLVSEDVDAPTEQFALLSILEPLSIAFGAFDGPGSDREPRLRLIVTVSDTLEVR